MLSMISTVSMLVLCMLYMTRIQWWQDTRGQNTLVLFLLCYTACNVIYAYIDHVLLASISQNPLKDSLANVKFRLSCTVCIHSRTLIIRTPVCHFNLKGVQISEFVQIS